jgi:hypothetical protein
MRPGEPFVCEIAMAQRFGGGGGGHSARNVAHT